MRDLSERCAMAVMAKAPVPGRCKTRLVPPLDHGQAAAMSAAFLRDITENIAAAGQAAAVDGWVAYAPVGLEGLFQGHLADGTQLVLADGAIAAPQGVQGFGKCLLHALRDLLAMGYGSACVVNSDSPTLPTQVLLRAAAALARPGERAVLGPAEDGGYYLLGVKTAHAHLLEDIAWSTEHVAAQTRVRAEEMGLELAELPEWYDVDDAGALRRLLEGFAAPVADGLRPYEAAASRAAAARLGLREHAG